MTNQIEMKIEHLQPWSTFVLRTKLPDFVLEKMIKITDKIIDEGGDSHGQYLAGQIKSELEVPHKILEEEGLMGFFNEMTRQFVVQQTIQQKPLEEERILQEEYITEMLSMWIISQKDNEYNPFHIHTKCALSTVMYLKIPEYLPSRKEGKDDDGAINFIGNASKDRFWGAQKLTIKPEVGDFFIFSASQGHFVYPFRTADGKGERRSVSFNARYSIGYDEMGKRNESN